LVSLPGRLCMWVGDGEGISIPGELEPFSPEGSEGLV